MTKLVIFDLDGTLLNTITDLAISTNHALSQYGFPEHELSAYPYFVGNGINKLIERALPDCERNGKRILQMRKDFIAHYEIHKTDRTAPYPGIPELLDSLHNRHIGIAVASNKYHQGTEELVRHYFNTIPFQAVFGQREGVPAKPDPEVVRQILTLTGTAPENALYVGDSGVDMQTANNSNVTAVGVTWGFRPKQELEDNGARFIVNAPHEILALCNQTVAKDYKPRQF